MAWGRKETELPESLKGKTPEQVAQELADAAQLKADNAALKAKQTELENATNTQRSELQQMREKMATLEMNAQRPLKAEEKKERTSVLVDEDAAFREQMTPLANATMLNAARLERLAAEGRFLNGDAFEAKLFRQYRTEYEALCNQLSPEQACTAGTYDNVFAIIKGRHTAEILDMQKKNTGVFFTESSGHQPPLDQKKQSDELTDEEKKMAKKFGISEKDYVAGRNAVPVVGVV